MSYGDAVTAAIDHVINAFGDQVRRGPVPVPTYTHSLGVGLALIRYRCNLETVVAGFFHDGIEDTAMSPTMIQRLFNARVRYLVEQCSYDPKLGDTREGSEEVVRRVIALAAQGEVEPLKIECADYDNNLQTNEDLPVEFQPDQYRRGRELYKAGTLYIPTHRGVTDLKNTLNWEKQRLGL